MDRTGRAIVLMSGPYDSRRKKVNEVRTYDVFGSHRSGKNVIATVSTRRVPEFDPAK